ncbi:MAG TPA: FKBP-type peptidyl-prolyl cis-trans isomerase [Candidatus Saccharimonadia bacterium]
MKHSTVVGIGGSLVIAVVVVGSTLAFSQTAKKAPGASQDSNKPGIETPPRTKEQTIQGDTMELQKTDEVVGTGPEAVAGKKVTVHYLGTLTNGTKFDSSYDRNEPFGFTLGGGQVIKGWDEGVAGMKVGGKRKLVIPPEMGYGNQAVSTIPANSTLVFEVELLGVE